MGDRMSSLKVHTLEALSPDGIINVPKGHTIIQSGVPLQTIYKRSDIMKLYTAPISGNGVSIPELGLMITPKKKDSLILLTWMINCEMHHDAIFLIHQDGALITTPGYEGYNNIAGNNRWSGVVSSNYDYYQASTPEPIFIQYAVPAITTRQRTYTPAIRASAGTAYTFALNRCLYSSEGNSLESLISTGIAMEIFQ